MILLFIFNNFGVSRLEIFYKILIVGVRYLYIVCKWGGGGVIYRKLFIKSNVINLYSNKFCWFLNYLKFERYEIII